MSEGNRTTWLILARGRKVRHWRVGTVASLCALCLTASALGGALAGFMAAEPTVEYMVEADTSEAEDLIAAYEARIGAMRRQIDTITHQQVTERRTMEARIAELLERQRELTERQGMLGSVIQRAAGVDPKMVPAPRARPDANENAALEAGEALREHYRVRQGRLDAPRRLTRETLAAFLPAARDRAPTPQEVFHSIDRSLATLDETQRESVTVLASEASQKADSILRELDRLGVAPDQAMGGPFIALDAPFQETITALDEALGKLEAAKRAAVRAPIGHPVAGRQITSRFGPRRDPFNRRRAMHSGIDFRAGYGHPIVAAGAGKVVKAGPNGGYGRFVEIDHGNGFTTRYAHMQTIRVSVGQRVAAGSRIGDVGSTGRSTGPHLHYEVRRYGKAIDPIRFIRTGQSVARYL